MGWFSKLLSSSTAKVVETVADAVDEFHFSGEEKAEVEKQKQTLKAELIKSLKTQLHERDLDIEKTIRAELDAKSKIIEAELVQGDKFTKRARPSIVYFGLAMIGINFLIAPAIAMYRGVETEKCETVEKDGNTFTHCVTKELFPLPEEFWWAWTGVVGVYGLGRSLEKRGARSESIGALTGNGAQIEKAGKLVQGVFDDDRPVG